MTRVPVHDIRAELAAYRDGCERCVTDTASVVCTPTRLAPHGDGLLAFYCCHRCGHFWTCSWGIQD